MNGPFGWLDADIGTVSVVVTGVLGWGVIAALLFLVPLVILFSRATRRRRFWCALSQREVEVEYEDRGLPGFRWSAAVKSCSVFDPATALGCHRRCREAQFRRQWPPALPIGRLQ